MQKIARNGKHFMSSIFILSNAFYYALGVLWSSEIITASQIKILWALSLIIIVGSYFLYSRGRIPCVLRHVSVFHVTFALFIAFALLSILWATDAGKAYSRGSYLLKVIISMMMLCFFLQNRGDVRTILKSIEYGGYMAVMSIILMNGISGMIQMFREGSRLTYTGINSNSLGMVAAYSIVISVYFLMEEGFHFTSLLAIPCVFIIILSVSKKAIFIFGFGVVSMVILNNIRRQSFIKNALKITALLIVLLIAFFFLLKMPFMSRISDRVQSLFIGLTKGMKATGVDKSTYERLYLTQVGMDLIRKRPLIGVGLDNARFYNIYEYYLHNNYLELLADLGVFGTTLYYISFVIYGLRFIRFRNTADKEYNICLTLFALRLILDAGMVSYYDLMTYFFIILFDLKTRMLRSKRIDPVAILGFHTKEVGMVLQLKHTAHYGGK